MPIRVLIADDNTLFREGIANLLSLCEDVAVAGQAKNAAEAVHNTLVLRPDVVLMDISMPLGGGIQATRQILEERPEQIVCMLTASEETNDLFVAVRSGARGYLVKTVELAELCGHIKVLAEGGSVVSPHLASRLIDEFAKIARNVPVGQSEADKLTPREREVLEYIARGDSNAEIADRLVIAENTVKVHLRNIIEKLHLRNRQHLAAFAVREGIAREI